MTQASYTKNYPVSTSSITLLLEHQFKPAQINASQAKPSHGNTMSIYPSSRTCIVETSQQSPLLRYVSSLLSSSLHFPSILSLSTPPRFNAHAIHQCCIIRTLYSSVLLHVCVCQDLERFQVLVGSFDSMN